MMKSTNFLTAEHKTILRALDVLDALAAAIEQGGTPDQADVDQILDFLRWFADAHHQAKEDTILFPALKAAAQSQNRPIEHMKAEHDQERALVEEIEKDLRLAKPEAIVRNVNRLSSTLRNHIYKEDRILFETADAVFTPQRDQEVFEGLTHFETHTDRYVLDEKLKGLRALEWKYLCRSS